MFRFIVVSFFYLSIFTTSVLSEIVNKINVIGNDRISQETILMFSSISLNDDLDDRDLNNILKNLYDTDFFENVSVKLKDNLLEISVVENPLIEEIKYNGIKSEKLKSNLVKNLKLKSRSSYSELILKNDKNKILTNLKELGYYFSKVDVFVEDLNDNKVSIVYEIF